MRLIDANELTEMVWRERVDSRERIAELIARQPTIKASTADVQPVKRGEWKYYKNNGIYDTYKCSICNTPFELPMDADISQSMHYCPDCGAKMTNE